MLFYIGVVSINGILEREIMFPWRPKVTVKVAFKFGSSKHGNARRASVGCICDEAMYLFGNYLILNKVANKHLSF